LAFCRGVTPAEHVFALDLTGLHESGVEFFVAEHRNQIVGMGALRPLNDESAEIKSMHVLSEARGLGVGRSILQALIDLATSWGCRSVYLETGTMKAFEPARRLYRAYGFVSCDPFDGYEQTSSNMFMRLDIPQDDTPV